MYLAKKKKEKKTGLREIIPKFSLLVLVYNREKYLHRRIRARILGIH